MVDTPGGVGEPGTNGSTPFTNSCTRARTSILWNSLHPRAQGTDDDMHRFVAGQCARSQSLLRATAGSSGGGNAKSVEPLHPMSTGLHRTARFLGGRPSTFFLAQDLVHGLLEPWWRPMNTRSSSRGRAWNVFSYDQWGVELGKALAKQLGTGGDEGSGPSGPSSQRLFERAPDKNHPSEVRSRCGFRHI